MFMKTILIAFLYFLFSSILTKFIGPVILNIVGIPGALIGYKSTNKNEIKFIFGSILCALTHSYLYISIMVYVILISERLILKYSLNNYVIWIITFIILIGTIQQIYYNAKNEFKENKTNYLNPQISGLFITQITSFIVFVVFMYDIEYISPLWDWVKKIPQII